MKWLALTVLAVSAIGCCCNTPGQPAVDPFYGHMTVPPPGTGAIAPQSNPPYYQPPPGNPATLQPIPQGPTNPPYPQYQVPPGNPATLQPIPQQPGAAMPNPGGNNWINSRPGTSTSWTGQSPSGPGDVITIPVSQGGAPLGPAADGHGP